MNPLLFLITFVASLGAFFFLFFFLLKWILFFNELPKETIIVKPVMIDTMKELKHTVESLLNCVKTGEFSRIKDCCTEKFLKASNNGKNIRLDYDSVFDYYIQKETRNEVVAIIVARSYEIQSNTIKLTRSENGTLKIEEIL